MPGGAEVYLYSLTSEVAEVKIMNKGGIVHSFVAYGTDVVGGFDSLRDYVLAGGYIGALVGRTANRITKGKYTLCGKDYSVYCNNGENSLHGGKVGYSHRIWNVKPVDGDEPKLILTLVSPDGDENYPGTLNVTVVYTLLKLLNFF